MARDAARRRQAQKGLEFDSLEDFMQGQAKLWSDSAWQKLMQENQARDLVVGGSKEYYTIEYEG